MRTRTVKNRKVPSATLLRECIEEGLPQALDNSPDRIGQVFFPAGHLRALEVETMLVIGIRGAGKSYWSHILAHDNLRAAVHQQYSHMGHGNVERCVLLSWAAEESANIPSRRVLTSLIQKGYLPDTIWRTVVATQLPTVAAALPNTWEARAKWVNENVEESEQLIRKEEEELRKRGKRILLVFDALDRTASDTGTARQLLKGLFQTLLDFRRYKGIRLKAFIRPDMASDEALAFTDSSKLFSERANLEWSVNDLYGLLWQRLANNQNPAFREFCDVRLGITWEYQETLEDWHSPQALQQDDEIHRKLMHSLAGSWMGTDYRKGDVYRWLPKHLGDGKMHISPRSFLTALREASRDTTSRFSSHTYALHHESIREGVREASKIRVREVSEDYPWANIAMAALNNLNVPCEPGDVRQAWKKDSVINTIEQEASAKEWLLPWNHSSSDRDKNFALEGELVALGIFEERSDGRLNVPDVYRLGYELGRKGGIKLKRRGM
jgi:hypothetical protein